jgi:hypothetical protein
MSRWTIAWFALVFVAAPGICRAEERKLTIRFVPEDSDHPGAGCVGVTSIPVLPVKTDDTIKWKLKKDDDQPCTTFDPELVSLRFESDKVVSADGTGTAELKGHRGGLFSPHSADGKVIATPSKKTKFKYEVYFGGKLAADPELEVTGTVDTPAPKQKP